MTVFYQTENGRVSAAKEKELFCVEFGNMFVTMNIKELEDLYTMVVNTDFDLSNESGGLKSIYYRLKGADLTLGFSTQEVMELHELLEFSIFFIEQNQQILGNNSMTNA